MACVDPGPKCRNNPENVSGEPGSPKSLQKVLEQRLFGDFFGVPGGRHFRDFFGILGPEGPRDLCKGQSKSGLGETLASLVLRSCEFKLLTICVLEFFRGRPKGSFEPPVGPQTGSTEPQ